MFAAVFSLLWWARSEATDDPWSFALLTVLLLGGVVYGASCKD